MTHYITRFENGRTYSKADTYAVSVQPDQRLNAVVTYIENCVAQLRHHGGPTGLSFCRWGGSSNKDRDFREASFLAIDYDIHVFEELKDAADRLGFARVWFDGENKSRTQNTIVMVIPLAAPANKHEAERIICCLVKELDIYGLVDGALAINHITNIHATTLTAYERGALLDPQAFIQRTAKMYQSRDATKYYGQRPARVSSEPNATITTHDDLFEWSSRDADTPIRQTKALMGAQPLT